MRLARDEKLAAVGVRAGAGGGGQRVSCIIEVRKEGKYFAMERIPGWSCLTTKFSSLNRSEPYIVAEPVPSPFKKSPPWIL
jgi:hypothetical protein